MLAREEGGHVKAPELGDGLAEHGGDAGEDLVGGALGAHDAHAVGLERGEATVSRTHALLELYALRLEAVDTFTRGTCEGPLGVEVEDEQPVRMGVVRVAAEEESHGRRPGWSAGWENGIGD